MAILLFPGILIAGALEYMANNLSMYNGILILMVSNLYNKDTMLFQYKLGKKNYYVHAKYYLKRVIILVVGFIVCYKFIYHTENIGKEFKHIVLFFQKILGMY